MCQLWEWKTCTLSLDVNPTTARHTRRDNKEPERRLPWSCLLGLPTWRRKEDLLSGRPNVQWNCQAAPLLGAHATRLHAPRVFASYWYFQGLALLVGGRRGKEGVFVSNHQCRPVPHELPHHKNSFCIRTAAAPTSEAGAESPPASNSLINTSELELGKITLCSTPKTLLKFLLRINLNPGASLSSYSQKLTVHRQYNIKATTSAEGTAERSEEMRAAPLDHWGGENQGCAIQQPGHPENI